MIGLLTFLDPPRPDTKQTIADARSYGVQVKMITGKTNVSVSLLLVCIWSFLLTTLQSFYRR